MINFTSPSVTIVIFSKIFCMLFGIVTLNSSTGFHILKLNAVTFKCANVPKSEFSINES